MTSRPRPSTSRPAWAGSWVASAVLAACGQVSSGPAPAGADVPAPPSPSPLREIPAAAPRVVFLGDSLAAGLHLERDAAFPALVGQRLAANGRIVRIVNAGVSGDTTAGGLRRLDWLLQQQPDVLVVELGANDGLRGQPLEAIEENLDRILARAKAAGARVLLLGMRLPPSYGREYSEGFAALYPRLAEEHGVELVPFLLEGVAGVAEHNLEDGMHPNESGQAILAENVLPHLERVLGELGR